MNYATYLFPLRGWSPVAAGLRCTLLVQRRLRGLSAALQLDDGRVAGAGAHGRIAVLRSSTVIQKATYGPKRVSYHTFDADGTEVLRLNFRPSRVSAGEVALEERKDLKDVGYTLEVSGQSDFVVRLRHQGAREVVIEGR